MAFLAYLFCLIVNVLIIRCDKNISVEVAFCNRNSTCTVASETVVQTGENVSMVFKRKNCDNFPINVPFIWIIQNSDFTINLTNGKLGHAGESEVIMITKPIKKHMDLRFNFYYLLTNHPDEKCIANSSRVSTCSTKIRLPVDTTVSKPNMDVWVYTGSAVGALFSVTIITQTFIILKLKAKAKFLNREKNLSSRQPSANDSARYIQMPGQKASEQAIPKNDERESQIYECVEILTAAPPEPPAISTLPRKKELNSIPTNPINLRPPVPLPIEEEYEDVNIAENTYKPPAFNNIVQAKTQQTRVQPPRYPKPTPPKPTASANYKGHTNTLAAVKPKSPLPMNAKPSTMPKKAGKPHPPDAVTNELDTIFKKRLNVMNIPVQQIAEPAPSKKMRLPLKPNPLPIMKKPTPPASVQHSGPSRDEEHYSSDEEWTYEPLKPISF